jgi:carbamoyl-phosphate synthase large subunit
VKCESIFKISEGRPNPSDYLKNGEITMMMITSSGDEPDLRDGKDLRRLALTLQVRHARSGGGATRKGRGLGTLLSCHIGGMTG